MLTRGRAGGFGLFELMVAVSILAILGAVAMPNFTTWIQNARVRTAAEALQSSVRLAQAEAQRRSHTVVFFLTNSSTCTTESTAKAGGSHWQIMVVPDPLMDNDDAETVQCGVFTDASSGIALNSRTTALCFGADGRQTKVADPAGIGASCAAGTARFDVAPSNPDVENRQLRLVVTLAGAIRLCDLGKPSTAPDGCPRS